MKSKTKKLFLTLFAFASLSLAACGGGSSSSSGTSEGSSDASESSSGDGSSSSSSSEDPVTVIPDIYVKVNNDEAKLDYDDFSEQYAIEEVDLVTTDVISVYTKDDEDEPVSLLEKIVFADTDSEALMNAECNGVNEDGTYSFFLAYDEDEDKYALTVIKKAAAVTYTLNVGTTVYKFIEAQKDPASEAPNQLHNYVSIQDVEITKNTAFVWKDGNTVIDQHIGLNPNCNAVATTEAEHTTFKFHNDADAGKVYFKTWDNENLDERDGQIHGYSFWIPGYQPNPEDYAPYSLFVGTQEYKMLPATKDAIDHELANYETENAVTITGDQTFSFKDDNGNVIAANIGPNDGANADATSTPGVFKFHNDAAAGKIYLKTYDNLNSDDRDGQVHSYSFWVPGKTAPTPPTPTKTGLYLRGDAVGSWDPIAANELDESSDTNNLGELLDVAFVAGEFKIGDSDWSHVWGWDYDSHVTIASNTGAEVNFHKKGGTGLDANNIVCDVPGTYDIYLTTNNYIYVEVDVPVVQPVFKAYLGTQEITKVPTEDQDNPSNKAEFVINVTAVEGALSVTKDDVPMDIHAVDNVVQPAGTKSFSVVTTGEHRIFVTSEEEVWITTPNYPVTRTITATFDSDHSWFLGDSTIDIFAYYWGSTIDAGWVKATFTAASATFELPNDAEGFLLTRCYKDSTAPDWWVYGDKVNRIYNKSSDVVLTASNSYEVSVPAQNENNGPVRLIKVTRGSNTFNVYAKVQGSGDSTEYYAVDIELKLGDKLSAINNETGIEYTINVKSGCASLYPTSGVVADGQYDVYIDINDNFWIQVHTPSV